MEPEQKARENIDNLLAQAGWSIQDMDKINLGASLGVAIREFPLKTGPVDYLLFINRKAIGVLEAKPEGHTLTGVDTQTEKYMNGYPENYPYYQLPLPIAYESTGIETLFRDMRDPDARSRNIFAFHKPETLLEWIKDDSTLRNRLKNLPPLITTGLYDCQIEAINNLETSLAESRLKALIQMATGSGKTFTAVSFIYRLIQYAQSKRVLFLVDRGNLGRQAFKEFQQYVIPGEGRKFTEVYNVQHLKSNKIDPVNRVCITTIQRLYSMLRGESEYDSSLEEESFFETAPIQRNAREVYYNSSIPIETFDFIVTDECHRSIYNLWRQVLEYYDSFIIGLTATPSMQTIGFFNQNLVMQYNHARAVADGINVGYDVYRIDTRISQQGSTVDAGFYVDKRDKLTRQVRWEQLDDDLTYQASQLDRSVVTPDQIRTIIRTFRDRLFTEIFPGRKDVPKTLIFAKDDSHADDIVHIVRDEFGKGNDFCKKITYRTTGEKPEDLLQSFRNSYNPRIVVTVDMISTGTDIKPLECLVFMRDVRSQNYFEQMKGRGTRVISTDDLRAVTPDVFEKTHFVIVDAVGVCESDKTESKPLECKKSVPFDKLMKNIAIGVCDEESISSMASRLARFNHEIDDEDRDKLSKVSGGKSLNTIINDMISSIDPDNQVNRAKEKFQTDTPTEEQIKQVTEELLNDARKPFDNPDFRNMILDIKTRNEQTIDTVSQDELLVAEFDQNAKDKAESLVKNFTEFIEKHQDEIIALQIILNKPYRQQNLTYQQIKELADTIEKPPYKIKPELLWRAYEHLEKSKVKNASPQKLLTNIISLIKFATGQSELLRPYSEEVDEKFNEWLTEQQKAGINFTEEQKEWLKMIKDHISTSLSIDNDDFELAPFKEKGGLMKVYNLFGDKLSYIIEELNNKLAA